MTEQDQRARLEALDAKLAAHRAAQDAQAQGGMKNDFRHADLAWRMVTEMVAGLGIGFGIGYGLDRTYVSMALGLATWIALAGPFLVMVCGLRFGRFRLLGAGMILTFGGTALFHWSGDPVAYLVANCGTGITWGFVIAYLLGMSAEFDAAGRASAFAGFVSKMGLASGPLAAGAMLGSGLGFAWLLNGALAVLVISWALMLWPARVLDNARHEATQTGTA